MGREDTERFLSLFAGREVGYALQRIASDTGNLSYEFVGSPLSLEIVTKHILGELTIAGYPLRTDNTVKFTTVEVRPPKRVIEANLRNQGYLTYMNERARHEALSLRSMAAHYGIPAYVDCNGEFSHRLWVFFREFAHFLKVKDFLNRLLKEWNATTEDLVIEPFLGTKGVGVGWMEQPILLPLGLNRTTGKRVLFLDEHGQPFEEQLKFIKKLREFSFTEAMANLRTPHHFPSPGAAQSLPKSATELIGRCPVLAEITSKTNAGRALQNQEKLVLFYTIGILDMDGGTLHRLLEPCPDYNYEKVERQRSRIKPNPMSCLKIRELVPEITTSVSCNCTFDLRGGKYPSPLLHVKPYLVPASEDLEIPDRLPPMEAAKRFLNLVRQAGEIERAMERVTKLMDRCFYQRGITRIKVGTVALVRKQGAEGSFWEVEALR